MAVSRGDGAPLTSAERARNGRGGSATPCDWAGTPSSRTEAPIGSTLICSIRKRSGAPVSRATPDSGCRQPMTRSITPKSLRSGSRLISQTAFSSAALRNLAYPTPGSSSVSVISAVKLSREADAMIALAFIPRSSMPKASMIAVPASRKRILPRPRFSRMNRLRASHAMSRGSMSERSGVLRPARSLFQ